MNTTKFTIFTKIVRLRTFLTFADFSHLLSWLTYGVGNPINKAKRNCLGIPMDCSIEIPLFAHDMIQVYL